MDRSGNKMKIDVPSITNSVITKVRQMTKEELETEGWGMPTLVLELNTGVKLYASGDDEGNDSGTLFGKYKDKSFYVTEE